MATKVQVIFYSTYGHVYALAEAIAEGAGEVVGTEVKVLQVAETLPVEVLEKMGAVEARKRFAKVPLADPKRLAEADAIILGSPTRYGSAAAQMRAFLDATGQLWAGGALIGKVGSRVYLDREPARRPRDDAPYNVHIFLSSRDGNRRRAIQHG